MGLRAVHHTTVVAVGVRWRVLEGGRGVGSGLGERGRGEGA